MIKITTDIFCDSCHNWIHGSVGKIAMKNWAEMIAKEMGWITEIRNGRKVDIRPDCQNRDK